jgi:hypothetical protein
MKYSLILFFVLFAINNLLHYISEKVIIVIFIVFLYFLMKFLSTAINNEFKTKIDYILNDINMYMNVVFNFLYINKLFYLNLKSLRENFIHLNSILVKKINKLNISSLLYKSLKSRGEFVFFK